MVIACDGRNYWRKGYYKYYKYKRSEGREESTIDWGLIFECGDTVIEELRNHFPYKVIRLDGCEADDVIAILTKNAREGDFGQTEPVMIISSDNDMSQLQKYDKVEQYSPQTKKMIKKTKQQVKEYVNLCVVKGQGKDGIPPLLQADDWFVNGVGRATPIRSAWVEEFLEKGIDACKTDEQRSNYVRNQTLMCFEFIPEHIEKSILDEYNKPIKKFDRFGLWTFLVGKRCNNLLERVEDF